MITNEQIIHYMEAIEPEKSSLLRTIEDEALLKHVPIVKKEVQRLLRVLLRLKEPKSLLEIGTAVGFSSILMSDYLRPGGHIYTIERHPEMVKQAKSNIIKANKSDVITIIEEDAEEALKQLEGPFDCIFMDAAKGQYINFLPYCVDLLAPKGLLISDNVLQEGKVAKSRYSIARRQRTIHSRMREYLWEINHHPLLETSILPIGDGLTLSYKKETLS